MMASATDPTLEAVYAMHPSIIALPTTGLPGDGVRAASSGSKVVDVWIRTALSGYLEKFLLIIGIFLIHISEICWDQNANPKGTPTDRCALP
jgi:hypothetical protein